MDNPAVWAVIWLAVSVGFGAGELMMPGSFFLLPFAVGALAATTVALLSAPLIVSFPVFIVVSFGAFLGLWPLARRLDATTPEIAGVGANRLIGATGRVIEAITPPPSNDGAVLVGTEEWKAVTTAGIAMPIGMAIRVLEVRGTRLIVEPSEPFGYGELQ